MKYRTCIVALLFTVVSIITAATVSAQEKITVAVAANYIQAFSELADRFEEKTGIETQATFASTGSLYNQITSGAPYDLYLAADEKRPRLLFEDGLCDEPFIYARGRAILWSADHGFCERDNWKDALTVSTGKIALANPVTAPYGTVALKAIRQAGLESTLKNRFVTAQTVAQSFQYASTGAVDAGFCALSATVSKEGLKGCFYRIPEAEPVIQTACILTRTEQRNAAEQFVAFILSDEALEIRKKYGYE